MELLVKLYEDKPSRIGIKFTYEYKAIRSYEELITRHKDETFYLKVEPQKDKLYLSLQSEQTGVTIPYKDLDYKQDQLKKLLAYVDKEIVFQFVHIYSNANKLLVAKPFRTENFLLITSIGIISPSNF